jgi:soluble lytic murein transglycosylase-like protein
VSPLFPASGGGGLFPAVGPSAATGLGPSLTAPVPSMSAALAAAAAASGPGPPASAGGPPAIPAALRSTLVAAAEAHDVSPALLAAVTAAESGFDPAARSSAGAMGLTQLMPATAAALGVADPYDPTENLMGGAAYLADQLGAFGHDVALALAAYNAGPAAVRTYGGIPPYPETQAYVAKVTAWANAYAQDPALGLGRA